MNTRFSIIIPVYNVAQYLRDGLESLLAQTVNDPVSPSYGTVNWEAICIDDGSTDGSGDILDQYAARDKRIKVIHQSNKGVCRTRQIGLDQALGEYVTWFDPDDVIAPDYLETLNTHLINYSDSDIVGLNFTVDYGDRKVKGLQRFVDNNVENLRKLLSGEIVGMTWNKIFRRRFLELNNIRFAQRRVLVCEDTLFAYNAIKCNPRITNIDRSFYYYRIRTTSVTHSKHNDKYYESLQYVGDEFLRLEADTQLRDSVLAWRADYRFEAYRDPNVSNEFFGQFFPEARRLKSSKYPLVHRYLFSIAVRGPGWRSLVMKLLKVIRILKGTNI